MESRRLFLGVYRRDAPVRMRRGLAASLIGGRVKQMTTVIDSNNDIIAYRRRPDCVLVSLPHAEGAGR